MTRPPALPIPLNALLPPSTSGAGPSHPFPSQSVILGPLPPTSPLHIGLDYLSLADLEPYQSNVVLPPHQAADRQGKGKQRKQDGAAAEQEREVAIPQRVLVITTNQGEFQDAIEEDDEDWLRLHGGDLGVLHRLRRVDMRYCPSAAHLRLLLTLLSESTERSTPAKGTDVQLIHPSTGVIILWDLASLLMREEEGDENLPPDDADVDMPNQYIQGLSKKKHFKEGVCISDYLDILAAARATVDHLSSLHPSQPPVQLIVLEPNVSPVSSLPIMSHTKEEAENEPPKMSRAIREKRIPVLDGARWMFGKAAVGMVTTWETPEHSAPTGFTLAFDVEKDEVYPLRRVRCGRAEWAVADNIVDEGDGEITDHGGWRWEWCI